MELKQKILLIGGILLTIAGIVISAGWLDVERVPALTVALPAGISMIGLFLILRLVGKESKVAADDQQKELRKSGIDLPRDEAPAKRGSILAEERGD